MRTKCVASIVAVVLLGTLFGCAKETSPAKSNGKQPAANAAAPAAKEESPAKPAPAAEKPAKAEKAPAAAAAPKAPLGLEEVTMIIPEDNPLTPEKIELGKLLYFDPRLSRNGKISVPATCHDPKMGWAERTATSKGVDDQIGGRNAPSVINAAYAPVQFWDGRAATLEEQALGPIENPIEMGHKLDAMVADLSKIDGYKERFQKVFGTGITKEGVAKAIAAFERTILSGNSAYDKFKAGDDKALDDAQKRGMELFETAGCATCHAPPLYSTYKYYNAGVGADKKEPDAGRKAVTKEDADAGKFRVPSLRDAHLTGPYFHDGSATALDDAVAWMAGGNKDVPGISVMFKSVAKANLTEENRKDIVAFLKALSGEFPVVEPPQLP